MYHSTAQNLSLLGSILYATNDQVASLDAQEAGQGFGPVECSGCRILPALHGRLGGRDEASVAHQVAHRALLVAGRCAFELTVRWIDRSEAVLRTKIIIFRVGGETKLAPSNYTNRPWESFGSLGLFVKLVRKVVDSSLGVGKVFHSRNSVKSFICSLF